MSNKIIIYTDGACRGQNGKSPDKKTLGAWSYIIQYLNNEKEEFSCRTNTTSNKEEMTAAIKALSILKKFNIPIILHSDSKLVVNGMNEWIHNWIKNGWKTKDKEPVKNRELWEELLALSKKFKDITFVHVKGHADNELNIRCDKLCNKAMDDFLKDNPDYLKTRP